MNPEKTPSALSGSAADDGSTRPSEASFPCPCGRHLLTAAERGGPCPEPCRGTVGSKPWWMNQDQYEADGGPCACILPAGHKPPCACDHTISEWEKNAAADEGHLLDSLTENGPDGLPGSTDEPAGNQHSETEVPSSP